MKIKKKIDLNKIYYDGWELHNFDNADNFRNYQFKLLKKFIKGKIAEIGPGNGKFVDYYKDLASQIHLFEPSKNIFSNLKNKFSKEKKIKIFNKNFISKKNYYDCIIYLDVIEHIKNDKEEIFNALKYLKKDGWLIINVPAFQLLYSQFDKDVGHFRRYNKSQIKKLLKKKNTSYVKMTYYDSIGFILSLISKIFINKNYKNNFSNKIKLWDMFIPLSFLIDKLTFNILGKSLIVFIKK